MYDSDKCKPKAICVLVGAYWNMSGGDKKIAELVSVWKEKGIHLYVYAPKKFFEAVDLQETENLKLIDITSGNNNLIVSYIRRTILISQLLRKIEEDIVIYSSSDFFPDVMPAVFIKRRNKHAYWFAHNHHIVEHFKTRPGKRISNFLSYFEQQVCIMFIKKYADKILYVSPISFEYLVNQKKIEENRFIKVENGVNSSYIDSLEAFQDQDDKYDIIMCARLKPSKGIFEIPAIINCVKEKYENVNVGLIGEGDEENVAELERLCKQYGVQDNVKLLGFCNTENVYRLIKSSKVFMFTSHEEGWGIALAEAMACGTAVVAYDLEIYKYVFKEHIMTSSVGDAEKMAKHIIYLLENEEDRKRLAEDAKKFVDESYDWKLLAQKEFNNILEVIK